MFPMRREAGHHGGVNVLGKVEARRGGFGRGSVGWGG